MKALLLLLPLACGCVSLSSYRALEAQAQGRELLLMECQSDQKFNAVELKALEARAEAWHRLTLQCLEAKP